jgi:hypothetical protein
MLLRCSKNDSFFFKLPPLTSAVVFTSTALFLEGSMLNFSFVLKHGGQQLKNNDTISFRASQQTFGNSCFVRALLTLSRVHKIPSNALLSFYRMMIDSLFVCS